MDNGLSFLPPPERTTPVVIIKQSPVISGEKKASYGLNPKLLLIVLTMALLAGVVFSQLTSDHPVLSAISAEYGGSGADYSRVFRTPDASLRDAVNGNIAPPARGEGVWTPPPNSQRVVVNGQRGVYDARGNFFPVADDAGAADH